MPKTRKRARNARNYQSPASTSASGTSYPSSSGTATPPTNGNTARKNGVQTPSSSSKTAGRNTQNSKGHRGRKPVRRKTPVPKGSNGRGRKMKGKDNTNLQSPNTYKADNGEVYRIGDFAYVDSQQAELPFHICVIRDFKLARKDSVIAEVKWFYRVSELPEAVYLLLMEDRKKSIEFSLYEDPKVNHRELFMAYNVDTHPASLFKGKCTVKEFAEVQDHLTQYMDKPDTFFYSYGYKPESRRLTLSNEESYVPHSQQAVLPECLCPEADDREGARATAIASYKPREGYEEMVWKPQLTDDELLMYLRAARSIALHAGVCMTGYIADGYLAASADETTQRAFDVLHKNDHNTEKALQDLVKRPTVGRLIGKKNWSKESAVLFGKGMRQFGKNFSKIKKELLPEKEISELSEYYYYWKKTSAGLSSRSTRRQRKMTHIRMGRALLKPRELTPEKEYMDWESCDEEDADFEDGEKIKTKSFYACRHCYSQSSTNWHHAGPDRAILCDGCRLYFQRYGCLKSLKEADKKSPPEFMFKDFHESPPASSDFISVTSTAMTSSPSHTPQATPTSTGRKTRNSNGSRGTSSRPGLRSSKKNYSKSDTDEEDEGEGSAESSESSGEDEVHPLPVSKQKSLQARRSILENIDDNVMKPLDEPPAKRAKRDEAITTLSEEEGSADSTNGEGDQDSSQKSPASNKSPGQSSTTSSANPGDEEGSPCSSQSSINNAYTVPQQFKRVRKDHESSCARTDLIYVHPPAEEKKLATSTNKVLPPILPGSSAYGGAGGHSLETPGPSVNVKVPIITPHAPQLPIGPPSFMGFPLPYHPMTPLSAGAGNGQEVAAMAAAAAAGTTPTAVAPVVTKREMTAQERGEHHQLALWQQQQQQQQQQQLQILAAQKQFVELQQQQQQQQQQHHPHLLTMVAPQPTPTTVPLHPHHHPAFQAAVPTTANAAHSIEHAQHFNFLTAEELAARQQMALRMGIPAEHLGVFQHTIPGMSPAAIHPAFLANIEHLAAASRRNEEHAAAAVSGATATGMIIPTPQAPFIQGAVPGMPANAAAAAAAANMEQFVAQQQQAMLAAMSGGIDAQQQFMEFQRQCEIVLQQCQKDPSLYQNPQVQLMLQQRELLARNLQEQSLLHQNLMQRRQQELFMHQQQAELQKQFVLSRPPAPDEVHSRNRPGVIVQNQTRSGGH